MYTRPAPKNVLNSASAPSKPLAPLAENPQEPKPTGTPDAAPQELAAEPSPKPAVAPLPLNSVKSESALSSSSSSALGQLNNTSEDSQVLHETLNVINEHITDLRSPASNSALRRTTTATDSGSEYSSTPLEHRMSYIQGEETDEEEEGLHSRVEVESWSADAVAEYLFTSGVEKQHCEVFRDQEISGEVLLGMDQSSLFIKAFDLGSVGRRLKTWHKIKALQDEVNGQGFSTRRTTQTYGSEIGSEDARRPRSRANTVTRPISVSNRRLSVSQTPKASPTAANAPGSITNPQDDPNRPGHIKRPSAASVRELHHSRRHSSTDYRMPATSLATPKVNNGTFPGVDGMHKKQPSFDRNWTLGGAFSTSPRPLSSTGLGDLLPGDAEQQDSAVDLDRGYFSGTEADGKIRNVLRKRDSGAHSRKSSYAEEQRVRSATAISRQSRYGSMNSIHDGAPSPAAQKYYGIQPGPHRRTASTNTTDSYRPLPPAKDTPSPVVTKLDTSVASSRPPTSPTSAKHSAFNSDWLASVVNKPIVKTGLGGMRAISDNLTVDRSKVVTPVETPQKDSSIDSPGRTGSTTPSGGRSFDLDSPDASKSPSTTTTQASKNNRKKGKKETSAYTQGLLKISPQEAMKDADYSGWMKKKSSNLMTTWKPRLFVLRGRRLSYYYSEDDEQEKGLIDISFHRVLPADNEKLTGLHATITSVVAGGQPMPVNQSEVDDLEKGDDTMFIFKLVPPRAGLSRAVNFTKPTVHYFAVPNLKQGRLWMAALMKATIDRDDTKPITTTYQQKTISLTKAKQMRHRPPALMNLEESGEADQQTANKKDSDSLGVSVGEADSGVSGMDKLASQKVESADLKIDFGAKESAAPPQSA